MVRMLGGNEGEMSGQNLVFFSLDMDIYALLLLPTLYNCSA